MAPPSGQEGDPRWDFNPGPDPKAVAFLEAKGVQRSWRWPSMWHEQHAFGFTLAGVHRLDVLAAAKELVTKAVAEGETLETFRAGFNDRMKALGFSGPQLVTEFGEGARKVDLTATWRTKVIYDTNVRQAYAAAEWQAVEASAADFPAIQYHHTPQAHPRQQHLAWDKMVLPVGHPFWKTHWPPNGWYCKCFPIQVSVDELADGEVALTPEGDLAATGYTADPAKWPVWKHRATGVEEPVPPGVTPGFGFNSGQARTANVAELLGRRVAGLDPNMARAAAADLVNLPQFADLVEDAVTLGSARTAAQAEAAMQLRRTGATRAEADAAGAHAADRAGRFSEASWPVGVLPANLEHVSPEAGRVVVANAAAIGHSANLHPTVPSDWRKVQALLETGEAWRAADGSLTLFGTFPHPDGQERTWALALKPLAGAWRVRTLFETSPGRRARLTAKRTHVRRASS